MDISKITSADILERFGKPDVIWASPDCTTYSIAGISHHRVQEPNGNLAPVSEYAKFCDTLNRHVLKLISELQPTFWFIENPRGGMRKMDFMKGLPRYTLTYCQYGDMRMKPTDIFTNHPAPRFKPPCHNGDPCHVAAPRGARTGTQGLKIMLNDPESRMGYATTLFKSVKMECILRRTAAVGAVVQRPLAAAVCRWNEL